MKIALVLAGALSLPLPAVTLLQLESFEADATDWGVGLQNPNQPQLVADSGPAGAGDTALRLGASGGNGPGSRIALFNQLSWTGDFRSAGITAISVDLRNAGIFANSANLQVHLGLFGPGGWFLSEGVAVNRFQGWSPHVFEFADLLPETAGNDLAATLAQVEDLRFFHRADTLSHRGDPVLGELMIDNIRAIPEASLALWSLGMLTFLLRRKT